MTNHDVSQLRLSDAELLAALATAASSERIAVARLIELLAEVDVRRLYLGEGCSSLFIYCTQVLHLSEHAAYNRIEAARLSRKHPRAVALLREGSVTLTALCLLAPHLTPENANDLLGAVRHKSKREVEQLVAPWRPPAPARSTVRALPVSTTVVMSAPLAETGQGEAKDAAPFLDDKSKDTPGLSAGRRSPARGRAVTTRRGMPEYYRLHVTLPREAHDDLRRAQELLRHAIPSGDAAAVVGRALRLLVQQLERTRTGATLRPRRSAGVAPGSRRVPAAVRREEGGRDAGRCALVGEKGHYTAREA